MSEAAGRPESADDVGPGRSLARLRAERKLSVADVAQRLKYGARQIEALEAEEFSRLPGTTFVRGMIRGYAKLLEIDAEPLLKSLEKRHIPGEVTVDLRAKRVPFPDGTRRRRGTRVYAMLSVVTLAAVGVVLYEWHGGRLPAFPGSSQPQPQVAQAPQPSDAAQAAPASAPAEEPAASAPAPAEKPVAHAAVETPVVHAPAPVDKPVAPTPIEKPAARPSPATRAVQDAKALKGPGRIFMAFADDAWVEITDGDGQLLMAQLNPAGSSRVVSGHPPFSVVIGNAAAVRVVYNEKPFDLMPYVKVEVARFTLK
jgi:cytoskeleton protein RodZ